MWLVVTFLVVTEAILWAPYLYILIRFGILAAVFYNLFWSLPFVFPLTSDLSVWYAASSMIIFIAITALTVYAFSIARAGRPLLRDDLLPE